MLAVPLSREKPSKNRSPGAAPSSCCWMPALLPDRKRLHPQYCRRSGASRVTTQLPKKTRETSNANKKAKQTHKVQNLQAAVRFQTFSQTACPHVSYVIHTLYPVCQASRAPSRRRTNEPKTHQAQFLQAAVGFQSFAQTPRAYFSNTAVFLHSARQFKGAKKELIRVVTKSTTRNINMN